MDHDELNHLLVPRPDDVVDRKYRVRERLGAGGMGIVYGVEHVHTGRTYALKVLQPALAATPEGQRRFEAEARAIGSLRHPNVVDVVDFGYAGTGSARFPYLVMERLEGYPLSRTLVGGVGLPWPWVTSVLDQILSRRRRRARRRHRARRPEAGQRVVDAEDDGRVRREGARLWPGARRCQRCRASSAYTTPRPSPTASTPRSCLGRAPVLSIDRRRSAALRGHRHTCRPSGCAAKASHRLRTCTALVYSPTAF